MTFFCSIKKRIFCRLLLSLSHRDICKLLVSNGNIVFSSDSLYFRSGVDTREEDEEDWYLIVSLSECFENAEWRLLDVFFTHNLSNK